MLLTLAVFAVVLGGAWYRNERAVTMWVFEQVRFYHYRTGDNRLMNDLSAGRIKAGDDVEELIARHPPPLVVRHDNFVTLHYQASPDGLIGFEGTTVVAMDDKLIAASKWSCTYCDYFFDVREPALARDYIFSCRAEEDRQLEARRAATLAVAGFGATFDPWNLPQPQSEPGP
jgi:hypothetical protein